MDNLKPCPCCGGEAVMQKTGRDKLRIQCKRCALKLEQRCLRYSLEWLEQRMAESWDRRTPPEGMVLVPREITAETGHKAGMIGDFKESVTMQCEHCDEGVDEYGDTCEACDGAGEYGLSVTVGWDTIKSIHKRIVEISGGE